MTPPSWTLYLADLLYELRTNDATGSCGEHGIGHIYSGNGIGRSFSGIRRFWTSTYTCCYIFLLDLVPAVTFTPHDAT